MDIIKNIESTPELLPGKATLEKSLCDEMQDMREQNL